MLAARECLVNILCLIASELSMNKSFICIRICNLFRERNSPLLLRYFALPAKPHISKSATSKSTSRQSAICMGERCFSIIIECVHYNGTRTLPRSQRNSSESLNVAFFHQAIHGIDNGLFDRPGSPTKLPLCFVIADFHGHSEPR